MDEPAEHDLQTNPPPVQIKEPLALVSITRYLEPHENSIDDHVWNGQRQSLDDSGKGLGFEKAIIVATTRLLRDGNKTLKHVFSVPWRGTVMGSQQCTDCGANIRPLLPSSGVTFFAKDLQAVHDWLAKGGAGWCIPGTFIGPDLLVWVKLSDERILLLVIQAKCYFTGNIATLTPDTAINAIRTITPDNLCRSSVCKLFSASRLVFIVAASRSRSRARPQPRRRYGTGLLRCSQLLTRRKGLQMGNTIYCESFRHTHSPSTPIRKVFKNKLPKDNHALAQIHGATLMAEIATPFGVPSIDDWVNLALQKKQQERQQNKRKHEGMLRLVLRRGAHKSGCLGSIGSVHVHSPRDVIANRS